MPQNSQKPPWSLDLKSLLKAVGGECLHEKEWVFSGVGSDSRKNLKGRIFFALSGPYFDGHDFLSQAVQQGAACVVVHKEQKGSFPVTWVKVPDTLKALQDLSVYWRKKLNLKILAITGSCGKTTTKEFAKILLSPLKPCASPKSYNNHWGIPLSLLTAAEPESLVIQELGISGPGEMAVLCRLCEPVVSTVTTVAPAHLAGFKSLSHLAEEKKRIYLESRGASWIFNRDNSHTEAMYQELVEGRPKGKGLKTLTCSQNSMKDADIQFRILKQNHGKMEIEGVIAGVKGKSCLKFSGSHNVDNLMCACGMALLCGVSPENIWSRLPQCQTPEGRQKWFVLKDLSVLFDGYNANPSSMAAFFEQFHLLSGRRFFILGDMKELGGDSVKYHSALADHSALKNSEFLWHIGDYGEEVAQALRDRSWQGKFVGTKNYEPERIKILKQYLKKGDVVGIKGSRSFKLERALLDLTGRVISF